MLMVVGKPNGGGQRVGTLGPGVSRSKSSAAVGSVLGFREFVLGLITLAGFTREATHRS